MTSKERAELRRQANPLEAILHVGKGGVTEPLVTQADGALRVRELIKGRVLETAPEDVREVAGEIARQTESEVVQVIGRVFVLYRYNPELHIKK